MKRSVLAAGILLSLTGLAADTLAGAGAGAINQTFNTSARFEGMGGAGVAVPWGGDTNHWANPAQLAFRPGVHYMSFESSLAAGLADDIELTNEEMTLGSWGVTLLWAKDPLAGNYLDMGTQEGRDEWGNPTGTFDSYMATTTWGLGLDAVEVLERILGKEERLWSRRFSVAFGATWSDFEDQLAVDSMLQDPGGGSASASSSSRGLTVRATLFEKGFGAAPAADARLGIKLDLAFGTSLLNDSDEMITHVDSDQSDPMPRTYAQGYAIRLEFPFGSGLRAGTGGGLAGFVMDGIDPLISFTFSRQTLEPGYVWDAAAEEYVYERDDDQNHHEKGWGFEVGFANVLFLRNGHLEYVAGDIDDSTSGWGIQLPVGRCGGFRYDKATVPQATGLPDVTRVSWSLWVDPLAIVQATRDR